MRITAIRKRRGKSDSFDVYVDDELSFSATPEMLSAERLAVGLELDEKRISRLKQADIAWRTRETALNLLSYRPRSAEELRKRLLLKDFPSGEVDRCIEELTEKGYLDDRTFAESFVRDRVRLKPRGKRRLIQELRQKGVDGDIAQEAIGEVFDEENASELDLARKATARWKQRSGEDPLRARKRLYGFLARRGFSAGIARAIADERLERNE